MSATLRIMDDLPGTRFDADLAHVHASPTDGGRLELIVRRPAVDEREVLDEGLLDLEAGLTGDRWVTRDKEKTPAYLASQLTVINTRLLAAIEPDRSRWPLAGDQLYVDLDLCETHLPVGSRLAIGTAVVEISDEPHTGCAKFSARFGSEALRFINSSAGRAHRLRGLNARVVASGSIRVGDLIERT